MSAANSNRLLPQRVLESKPLELLYTDVQLHVGGPGMVLDAVPFLAQSTGARHPVSIDMLHQSGLLPSM